MMEFEFKKLIQNIKNMLRQGLHNYNGIFTERKNYGLRVKVYDVKEYWARMEIMEMVNQYNYSLALGEIQCYVVLFNGKRSVIIKLIEEKSEERK